MKILSLSYCLMLVFAVVMVACTGTDTETIRETVIKTQCQDGTTVTGDETCPEPETTDTTTQSDTTSDDDTDRGAEGCTTPVKGPKEFRGSSGDDNICGDNADNRILAGDGRDTVRGGGGDDYLKGEMGDDKLYGEAGKDELYGDEGRDLLDGGADDDDLHSGPGSDEFVGGQGNGDAVFYTNGTENNVAVTVDLSSGFAQDEYGAQDEIKEVENVFVAGTADRNTITGDAKDNRVDPGQGTGHIIDGEGGSDTLIVGGDATVDVEENSFENLQVRDGVTESVTLTGDGGKNTLIGGDGDDILIGGDGDDILIGGDGDDKLKGGKGANMLTGGGGADCFAIQAENPIRRDTIKDFETGEEIELSGALDDSFKKSQTTDRTTELSAEAAKDQVIIIESYVDTDGDTIRAPRGVIANVKGLVAVPETALPTTNCD